MSIKKRKAQITVFIILAIALLFLAALVFYVRVKILSAPVKEVETALEEVPFEFQPLQKFVTDCAEQTATRGLEIIGRQGGYIDTSPFRVNRQDPTESDAFYLDASTAVPYWFYLKSENECSSNCEFSSNKPELGYIEQELEGYVSAELKKCVGNFEGFEKQGFEIKELTVPKTDVVFTTYDTKVVVSYPIEAKKEGRTQKLTKFYVGVPLAFKKIYTLADQIEKLEADESNLNITGRFLEKQAQILLVGFSGLNKNDLPPMEEDRISGGRSFWLKNEVRNNVEDMLVHNLPFLQISSTHYRPMELGGPFAQDVYRTFATMDFSLDSMRDYNYNNIDVGFRFIKDLKVAKNTYFDIDCGGGICGPQTFHNLPLSLVGLGEVQRYEFHYDLSYPVLVEIYDPSALNKKGFSFIFALESNIRGNGIMLGNYFENIALDLRREISACDPDQRNSGDIAISVLDGETGEEINDTTITYGVGSVPPCGVFET